MQSLEWHNEKRKIKDLKPFDKNPRILSEKQAEDLKKSLLKFNLAEIPAINTDGRICAGHQRIKILIALGRQEEEIDVRVPSRPLTDEEFNEYLIRSNKNTGEWDFDLLMGFDVELLTEVGFDVSQLKMDFEPEIDDNISLPDGDKKGFQQMTFIVSDQQAEEIKQAILNAKKNDFAYSDNQNSNGNALHFICQQFLKSV